MQQPQLLLLIALLVAVVAAICLLARQSVEDTGKLAWKAEQLLLRLIPPTGTGEIGEPTWAGLTIRRIAHVVEYALLGIVAVLLACAIGGRSPIAVGAAALFCLLASLADETHKIFVDGRYFDPQDLGLDALGYVPVIAIALVVTLVH